MGEGWQVLDFSLASVLSKACPKPEFLFLNLLNMSLLRLLIWSFSGGVNQAFGFVTHL